MIGRAILVLGISILSCVAFATSKVTAQSRVPFSQETCTDTIAPEPIFLSEFDCQHYDLPAVGSSARFHRSEFVRWLMQQASYGNIAVAKDLLPEFIHVTQISPDDEDEVKMAVRRFRWLVLNEDRLNDSGAQILSCTLKSIQDDLKAIKDKKANEATKKAINSELENFNEYVDAETDHVVPLAEFWISYDLVVNQAQKVLADTRAGLATTGRLGLDADGQQALKADLEDGRCAMVPMLNQSANKIIDLPLPDAQKAMVSDAADLAEQLWTAVDNELGFELEMAQNAGPSSDEEPENMVDAVNHQLHCETIPPDPDDKPDDKVDECNGPGGAIDSAVLAPARALRTAFAKLDDLISELAREINLLKADLMKADRNLRTYSEVFADFSKEQMVEDAQAAENTLRAILREREFLTQSEDEQFWVDIAGTDFVEFSSENDIHKDCADGDCDFCSIDKPLSRDNLEAYLVCFHVQGLASAEAAHFAIESGSGASVGPNPLFTDACDPLGIFSGNATGLEAEEFQKEKDQAVTNCFIDWVWDYHPAAALSFEASMQ